MKFSLFAVLLTVAVAFIHASYGAELLPPAVHENGDVVRTYQGVNVYKTERACARQGGLCVHRDDCQSLTAIKRLCPENAHRGVECCYEVKRSDAVLTCDEQAGACMPECHLKGLRRKANDCAVGETCCVVVA